MSTVSFIEKRLPWRIEAFREYLTFETLQPASAVLKLFEGELFDVRNPRIIEMQNLLERRTGKDAWIPKRSGSDDIDWNVEGDVTRNKGRVFTSMLILYPKEWKEGKVALTSFGNALANGQVNKKNYYDFILTHFKYPHPAWKDNWSEWNNSEKELFPFIYILQTLVELNKISPEQAYINTDEVADYLHLSPSHDLVTQYAKNIVSARNRDLSPQTKRSDEIHRKINDILGFLSLTPYCYFSGSNLYLSLFDMHEKEKSNFWEKRKGQNKLQTINSLISQVMN